MKLPILYSFRRCPYAIRARFTLVYSGIKCELREVDLKNKPSALLEISPKGTVPVLQLENGELVDESLDIIYYALSQNDPEGWGKISEEEQDKIGFLIAQNDVGFTPLLRKYKYFERHPEKTQIEYREEIEESFLKELEILLGNNKFLIRDHITAADIAIFPFIRQFAHVDENWFNESEYKNIIEWLNNLLNTPEFEATMQKQSPWQEGGKLVIFPN